MINEIRNTVLAILNKNNNGYLTPEEFNLFAKQAQLEVFEGYFYSLNNWISKRNIRRSHSGFADITKELEEVLDIFTVRKTLTHVAGGQFDLPDNWYTLLKLEINNTSGLTEIERVNHYKVSQLLMSNLTAPNTTYPAYVLGPEADATPPNPVANTVQVYPDTIQADVDLVYVRYPVAPKWTYESIGPDGDPVFNDTNVDFQDFELPLSDAIDITIKICEYAGISIREKEVVQFEQVQEQQVNQQEA